VIRQNHPGVPANKVEFYRKYLRPVVDTFHEFGVNAEYRPVNDILANGRKIAGTGAAQIDDMLILVGNFIQDFNYEMMSKVLRVPDEKFRDKVFKTLSENLTTMRRESGQIPANADLACALMDRYVPLVGSLVSRPLDEELLRKADELLAEMDTPEWLFANDRRGEGKEVKIAEGVFVIQKMLKTPGGLIRVTAVKKGDHLSDVHLSGDFFFYPMEKLADLEAHLDGIDGESEHILAAIQHFYIKHGIETPGVQPEDFAQILTS
jgi:lipoate-protein ligase A